MRLIALVGLLFATYLVNLPTPAHAELSCRGARKVAAKTCQESKTQSKFCLRALRVAKKSCAAPNDAVVCFALYDPVCGRDYLGNVRAYGNSCELSRDGAVRVRPGLCGL